MMEVRPLTRQSDTKGGCWQTEESDMNLIWDATMNTGTHQRGAGNIERTAEATEHLDPQMSMLRSINLRLLAVQEQLYVQNQIRSLTHQQLAVSQEQPVQAMKTVQRLDITNLRLAGIEASLADICGMVVQQNALIQKSLHRLVIEAQELIGRTDQERAARERRSRSARALPAPSGLLTVEDTVWKSGMPNGVPANSVKALRAASLGLSSFGRVTTEK
jgi:hypothetical protein